LCGSLLRKAVIIDPDNLRGPRKKEENKKAIDIYRRILARGEHKSPIYLRLCKAYLALGRPKEAIASATKAIRASCGSVDGYVALGIIYERIKRYDLALTLYLEAQSLFPKEKDILVGLCRARFQLGEYKAAIKSIALFKSLGYKARNIDFLLGCCYEKTGMYRAAIAAFKQGEILMPKDIRINLAVARCYRKVGNKKASDKEVDSAITKLAQRTNVPQKSH
jgi:tetratricopeptide (TPR) repeat protein